MTGDFCRNNDRRYSFRMIEKKCHSRAYHENLSQRFFDTIFFKTPVKLKIPQEKTFPEGKSFHLWSFI